jgi:hypothetical protein
VTIAITGVTTSDVTNPVLLQPWRTSQEPSTIVHDIPGATDLWVNLSAAKSRQGTLAALYSDEDTAEAARAMLSGPELFAITYPDRTTLEFTFAVFGGSLDVELQRDRRYWLVRIPFREVS